MQETVKELTDEQLGQVTGGFESRDYDPKRKHEIELGEFVSDAYNKDYLKDGIK